MNLESLKIPKKPLRWADIFATSCWSMVLWPIWMLIMGDTAAFITTAITATFITYCFTELFYLLDQLTFKKWAKDNKVQLEDMDKQIQDIQIIMQDIFKKGSSNESTDRDTRSGNCCKTHSSEGTKDARKEE